MVVTNWSKTERKKLASFQQNVTNYQNVTQIDYFYFTWIQIVASCWFRECSSSSMVWWGFASLFANLRSSAGTQQPWCLPDPALGLWTWDDYNIGDREEQWASQEIVVCNSAVSAVVTWSLPCTATPTSSVGGAALQNIHCKCLPSCSTAETTDHLTTGSFSLLRTVSIFWYLERII